MASYPVPVLHFDSYADAQQAKDDQNDLYLGMVSRRGWAWFWFVILNYGGENYQSLRVVNQPAVWDYSDRHNPILVTPEVLADGWFCGVAVDPASIPSTLSQNLSDGAAAVAAAEYVEPSISVSAVAQLASAHI